VRGVAACAVVIVALAASPARADRELAAQPRDRFDADVVTIDPGEVLTFVNQDVDPHDVTADDVDAAGRPLFASATITTGQRAVVERVPALSAGRYAFHCSVHPFMKGALVVRGPAAGPAAPAPGLSVAIATATVRALRHGLVVRLAAARTEAVLVKGTVTTGGRRLALRPATAAPGATRTTLRLTAALRRALSHAHRARAAVTATSGAETARAARSLR
jgi:plastocyanin